MADKAVAKEKLFFPNLDGLRFFCFFAVFVYHCNGIVMASLKNDKLKSIFNFLFQNGEVGVNAFFVLSGFLITFLLIKEKKISNTVNLGNFYVRRILRIWPLFYTCVFLGFVIFPYIKFRAIPGPGEIANYKYYLFFACNFDFIRIWPLLPDASFLSALWSVAVEEQFYLSWPVILKFSKTKIFPVIFCAIIIFTLVFRSFHTGATEADLAVRKFHTFSVIGDMALGALVAYYCSYQSRLLSYINKMAKWKIVTLYILLAIFILYRGYIFSSAVPLVFERVILSSLFAFVIAEQNFAENSFFKFSNYKMISKLGIYTYGLYCLHFIAITSSVIIISKLHFFAEGTLVTCLVTCILALLVSIGASLLSYHLFEKHFLKLKNKFSLIVKQ